MKYLMTSVVSLTSFTAFCLLILHFRHRATLHRKAIAYVFYRRNVFF